MKIVVLAVIFLAVLGYEIPGMIKKQAWGDLAGFILVMLIAMGFSFARALGLKPNPVPGIEMIFKPVGEMLHKALS